MNIKSIISIIVSSTNGKYQESFSSKEELLGLISDIYEKISNTTEVIPSLDIINNNILSKIDKYTTEYDIPSKLYVVHQNEREEWIQARENQIDKEIDPMLKARFKVKLSLLKAQIASKRNLSLSREDIFDIFDINGYRDSALNIILND